MMLFFQRVGGMISDDVILFISDAPLQVRSIPRLWSAAGRGGKRALSWASRRQRGSLTLEAALGLPLFLFLCFCLMMPMRMLDRQRQIQAAVEAVGEELSRYAYVAYVAEQGKGEQVDTERAGEEAGPEGSVLTGVYAALAARRRINSSWVEELSFLGTEIGRDDMIHIEVHYRMRLPFSVLGLESIPVETICSRRMWTGAEGGRGRNTQREESGEEPTVYVGKSSRRYHRKRTCHYIYNDLRQVSREEAEGLRNQDGKKYAPCSRCGQEGGTGCYIMPSGTSWHSRRDCSAIISYVREVKLSEVGHLGACSYCGGG